MKLPEIKVGDDILFHRDKHVQHSHWFFWTKEIKETLLANMTVIGISDDKTKIKYEYTLCDIDDRLVRYSIFTPTPVTKVCMCPYSEIEKDWMSDDTVSFIINRFGDVVFEKNAVVVRQSFKTLITA